jgi:hypothetical protein
MEEMRAVAARTPALVDEARRRADAALSLCGQANDEGEAALREEFGQLAGAVA